MIGLADGLGIPAVGSKPGNFVERQPGATGNNQVVVGQKLVIFKQFEGIVEERKSSAWKSSSAERRFFGPKKG